MSSLPKRNPNGSSDPSGLESGSDGRARVSTGPKIRVSGFIQTNGRVLLVRQRRAGSTYWLLPGGGVQRGETLSAALHREVWEECALRVQPGRAPLALVESISPDEGVSRHLIQVVFTASILDDPTLDPGTGSEVAVGGADPAIREMGWFDAASVVHLTIHPPIQSLLVGWLDPEAGVGRSHSVPCVATGVLWEED